VEVVASLSQGRTAAAQCGLFTHKSVPVIFEPPCIFCNGKVCSVKEEVVVRQSCSLCPVMTQVMMTSVKLDADILRRYKRLLDTCGETSTC